MTLEFPTDENPTASSSSTGAIRSQTGGRVAVLVDEIAEMYAEQFNMAAPAQSTERIITALQELGYETVELVLRENHIHSWVRQLATEDFDFAVNLCETVAGHAEGEHLAAAAVELLELPKTGASAKTLLYCLNKDRCSAILAANGIPVPQWAVARAGGPEPRWDRFPAIVKPASDDASNGVHPNSVVRSSGELSDAVARVLKHWNAAIIQEFIDGREINLAIVGDSLLPPAEIDFSTLPDDSPPIVSFEAKWISGSLEDAGTRPVCPASLDPNMARELQLLAARAWALLDGCGYARVDIRLSDDGSPYVIDINPNPDLSIDAGLVRQASVAGWSYVELVERIVEAAKAGDQTGRIERPWVFAPVAAPTGEPV
jgi:D-alanine-D-alanine ligase